MVSGNWDPDDAAIARALHAVDPTEEETGPVDDDDVAQYENVLANFPLHEVPPPPDLEGRVLAAARAARPAAARAIDTRAARVRTRRRVAVLVAAGAAAVLAIGALVNGEHNAPVVRGNLQPSTQRHSDVDAVLGEPGSRTGVFTPGGARVALGPDGRGEIYDLEDPGPLTVGMTNEAATTILGTAVPSNGMIGFVVDKPADVNAVVLLRDGVEIARAPLPRP